VLGSYLKPVNVAVIDVVARGDDLQPVLPQGLLQDGALRLETPSDTPGVHPNRVVEQVAGLVAGGENGGDDGLNHLADHAGEGGVVGHHIDRRRDRTAGLMAQDDDQGAAEHARPVLDAAKRGSVNGVARVADDEQLAQATSEQQLRRDATVGATNQDAEGRLPPGQLDSAFAPLGGAVGGLHTELVVALLQQPERLIRGEGGLGDRAGRSGEIGRDTDGCEYAGGEAAQECAPATGKTGVVQNVPLPGIAPAAVILASAYKLRSPGLASFDAVFP
jgi:hypothetical protein